MTMRALSMSLTFKRTTSPTRNPAAYAVRSIKRYTGFSTAPNTRAVSSGLSTTGVVFGLLPYGKWTMTSGRPKVTWKKNRKALTITLNRLHDACCSKRCNW